MSLRCLLSLTRDGACQWPRRAATSPARRAGDAAPPTAKSERRGFGMEHAAQLDPTLKAGWKPDHPEAASEELQEIPLDRPRAREHGDALRLQTAGHRRRDRGRAFGHGSRVDAELDPASVFDQKQQDRAERSCHTAVNLRRSAKRRSSRTGAPRRRAAAVRRSATWRRSLANSSRASSSCPGAQRSQNHIATHPVEPRERLGRDTFQPPPGHEERFGCHLVRQVPAHPSLGKGVDLRVMSVKQLSEPLPVLSWASTHSHLSSPAAEIFQLGEPNSNRRERGRCRARTAHPLVVALLRNYRGAGSLRGVR